MNPQIAIHKNIPYTKRRMGNSPDETAFFHREVKRILRQVGFVEAEAQPFDLLHLSEPASLITSFALIGNIAESLPLVREIAGSIITWGTKPYYFSNTRD